MDRDGIENEVGLSALVDHPQVKQIFGDDIAFELRALFCSAHGPNLRNQVAHGLMSAEDCRSLDVMYAWWWMLRLTLLSVLQASRAAAAASGAKPGSPPTP